MDTPDESHIQDCIEHFHETVRHVVAQLDRIGTTRPLESLDTRVSSNKAFGGRIVPRWSKGIIKFRVNEGLLLQLYDVLDRHRDDLQLAVLWPVPGSDEQPFISEEGLLSAMYDLTLNIAILHELSHWLCGHLHLENQPLPGLEAIVESPDEVFLWVTEIEADNTAAEILIQAMQFESVHQALSELEGFDLPPDDTAFIEFDGPVRVIGFRMALTALWIVISLIEAKRGEADGYPLPSARLYASISTLMALYADLGDTQYDGEGNLVAQPADVQQDAIMTFLRHVVQPVAKQMAEFPSPDTANRLRPPLGETADPSESFLALLKDIQGLMFSGELATTGARQLHALQPARDLIDKMLAPHRYLQGMTNGPRA